MEKVEKYLSNVDPVSRKELERIRSIIKREAPEAIEGISYGMPSFKYKKQYMMGYASFKDHMSLFPTSEPFEALKEAFKNYKTSKGTLQFTLEKIIPDELVVKIVKHRIQFIDMSIKQKQK